MKRTERAKKSVTLKTSMKITQFEQQKDKGLEKQQKETQEPMEIEK